MPGFEVPAGVSSSTSSGAIASSGAGLLEHSRLALAALGHLKFSKDFSKRRSFQVGS